VTTELILIVGWTVLMLSENSVISLICYIIYYKLGKKAGFWDGILPLILVTIYMAIETAVILI